MAIANKPHERSSQIRRTVYKGRPSIYAVQDINRESSARLDFNDLFQHGSQLLRTNVSAVVTNISVANISGGLYRITYNFQINKENSGQPAYIHAKGVSFPFTGVNFNGFIDVPGKYSELQILMFSPATKKTFTDDNVLCGVQSDLTSPQESCEVDVFGTPVYIITGSNNANTVISNNVDKIYLGVIASIPVIERVNSSTGAVTIDGALFFDAGDTGHSHSKDKFDYSALGIFQNVRNSMRSLILKITERIEYLYSNSAYLLGKFDTKVDKVSGYSLSKNDFTDALLTKLNGIATNANNYTHPSSHPISLITGLQSALDGKASSSHSHSYLTGADYLRVGTSNRLEAYTSENISFRTSRLVKAERWDDDSGDDKARIAIIESFVRWNNYHNNSADWNHGHSISTVIAGYNSSTYLCTIEELDGIIIEYAANFRGGAPVSGVINTRGVERDAYNFLPPINISGTSYRIFISYDATNKRVTAYGYDSSPASPRTITARFKITILHAGSAGETAS